MGLRVITQAATEPISLAEVKQDLRIDATNTDFDAQLARYITTARELVELRTGRTISATTWEFVIDEFPDDEILLPLRPVQSITSIKYDDATGLEQTLSPASYYLDNVSWDNWVFPTTSWPATLDAVNAVRIRFLGGYADATHIPGPLKQATRLAVQELFDGGDYRNARNDLMFNHMTMVA